MTRSANEGSLAFMSVIVRHKISGEQYVLIGAGFGAYMAKKPNWFWGDLIADEDSGYHAMLSVCDAEGRVGWIESKKVEVVSVDGRTPQALLNPEPYR